MHNTPCKSHTAGRPFQHTFILCGLLPAKGNSVLVILGQFNAEGALVYKGLAPISREHTDFILVRSTPPAPFPYAFSAPGLKNAIWFDPDWACTIAYAHLDEQGFPADPVFVGMCEADAWLCQMTEENSAP